MDQEKLHKLEQAGFDLGDTSIFSIVIKLLIEIRPDYFEQVLVGYPERFLYLQFPTRERQIKYLFDASKLVAQEREITDSLLDGLPRFLLKEKEVQDFLSRNRDPNIKAKYQKCLKDRNLLVYYGAPVDTPPESKMERLCFEFYPLSELLKNPKQNIKSSGSKLALKINEDLSAFLSFPKQAQVDSSDFSSIIDSEMTLHLPDWSEDLKKVKSFPLESFECLQAILPVLVLAKPKYLRDRSGTSGLLRISFFTADIQANCLRNLIKILGRKQVPKDEDLKDLSAINLPAEFCDRIARDLPGYKDLPLRYRKAKKAGHIIIFFTAPMESPEETMAYLITNPQVAELPKKLNNPTLAQESLDDFKSGRNCFNCKKGTVVKMKACGDCRMAVYCSKECQRENWPDHKQKCAFLSRMKIEMEQIAKNEVKTKK